MDIVSPRIYGRDHYNGRRYRCRAYEKPYRVHFAPPSLRAAQERHQGMMSGPNASSAISHPREHHIIGTTLLKVTLTKCNARSMLGDAFISV
jgi:hypothetical protein